MRVEGGRREDVKKRWGETPFVVSFFFATFAIVGEVLGGGYRGSLQFAQEMEARLQRIVERRAK